MNTQNSNGWPPTSGPGAPPTNVDLHIQQQQQQQQQQRSLGPFGPSHPIQPGPPAQHGGPVLPPPPGPFYSSQANGHSLPTLAGLVQASHQANRPPPQPSQQHSPPSMQHPSSQLPPPAPPQEPGYALPTLGQAMQQQSPRATSTIEQDRGYEQEMHDLVERRRQESALMQREHERERELREQQQRESQRPSHENHTGSIPLQQPVASRIATSLHGPNGILSNPNVGATPNPVPAPLGAPTGPENVFANGVQPNHDGIGRPFLQQTGQNIPPQQLLGFGASVTPQQIPGGMAALSQGQQPILNDALSYLDQVKVRFVEQPEVYNKFLDIMKDFKSQAIDTPGVIDRVSALFNGHPHLIQGFNTFLPPGYRIECGTRDDPNSIRVTTPMGTTVSQMSAIGTQLNGGSNGVPAESIEPSRNDIAENAYRARNINWQQTTQTDNASEETFSPGSRPGTFGVHANDRTGQEYQYGSRENENAVHDSATMAQERGVSQLQNAVNAASNGIQSRQQVMQVSPSGGVATTLGQVAGLNNASAGILPGNQLGIEKRGPVEFNHAISYVNKIKNRFASQPEIYKQFLEILQTYQRESKPIQDVYAQVTQLFSSAPDLLEDFKQFLPESAAQAKAQAAARQATEDAAMLSNVRGEPGYLADMQKIQRQTPRPETKMPPIGNFAHPPSVVKENKKRRGGAGSQVTGGSSAVLINDTGSLSGIQNIRNGGFHGGNAAKRPKMQQTRLTGPEVPVVSPTLIPDLPQPLPPTSNSNSASDEIAFFDRVRKFISNRQTFNEFLKLCNLFSQDLIDKNVLVHKASNFIGGNPDLMSWFKNFVLYDGRDEVIENRPVESDAKVVLSNCRALGPSYRLLPRRERLKTCSGRDEMCQQVLNDEWASHPTWASEDSGFIAHRKNLYEESLHRIEEERHDYDFNIETCTRTVQLLEPIVQQIKLMSDEERSMYSLPPGIGASSEAIYQRVIKKIYDRERGGKVIEDMFARPAAVCPIILGRLKQKTEEWKASQREWEKVWREQTLKQFWKSLDHQGLNARAENKRQFQPKSLQTDIQTKYEEQKRQRIVSWSNIPKYQFQYSFDDVEVIQDACHIILTYIHFSHAGNSGDQAKAENFFKTFIPAFFGIDRELFQRRVSDIYDASPPNEEIEDDLPANEDHNTNRGRRTVNGRKGTLLRGVLERGQPGKPVRKDKDGNSILESKESTPDVMSMDDESVTPVDTPAEQPSRVDITEHRWMEHPISGNGRNRQNIKHNEPFQRDTFNLYANLNIYCFMRMFQMLYERLVHIKENEKQVHEDVRRAKAPKAAFELKLADKSPSEFFMDTSLRTNYYRQIVHMCEDVLKGEMDMTHVEETLRRFYMQYGWQLYNFDKMLSAMVRFVLQIFVNDNKDKSSDIINLFYKNRKDNETTHQAEIDYRKQVEKLAKDGDIYRIAYTRSTRLATIQILKKDDATFSTDSMTASSRWSYYVSSYVTRDWTEGVPSGIQWPFLRRNLPTNLSSEDDYNSAYVPQWNEDGLVIRICPGNYHLLYDSGSTDWWVHDESVRKRGMRSWEDGREKREERFKRCIEGGREQEDLVRQTEEFEKWIKGAAGDASAFNTIGRSVLASKQANGDEVMTGT